MKLIHYLLFILFLNPTAYSQNVRTVCTIPSSLSENSGMLISNANRIWLHNDSGDSAKLYLLDTLGTILRTILVQNVTPTDWEDITRDNQGNVYIGDFGNNLNSRQNLSIYKIPNPDSIIGDTVNAEIINYYYPEQTSFPPINAEKKYDTEAVIYYADSLYIFTKDRTDPHLGYTWLYQIPADTGNHAAILLDSFHTNQISFLFEVTGASLSPNGTQLALLGATQIWVFWGFEGNHFFDGTLHTFPLGGITQNEGLDFLDKSHLYFSNETSLLGTAKLSVLDLVFNLSSNQVEPGEDSIEGLSIFPNPTKDNLHLSFNLRRATTLSISLLDQTGKRVKLFQNKRLDIGLQDLNFSIEGLSPGAYFVQLRGEGRRYGKRVILY